MNELLDAVLALDKLMLAKISAMKNAQYVEAVLQARVKLNEAVSMIALANK